MDLSEKDEFGLERRNGDHLSVHESVIPSDWRFGSAQAGLFSSIPACQADQAQMGSSFPSASMVASLGGRRLWGTAINSQNPLLPPPRFDVGWSRSDPMLQGGAFPQNGAGSLPPGLSHFPSDSTFIERAARFSCYGAAAVGGTTSPFSAGGPSIPFSRAQKNEVSVGEASEDASMSVGSPLKIQRAVESGEHELSARAQDETQNSDNTAVEPSSMGFSAKKRKSGNQEMELDQAEGDNQMSLGNPKGNAQGKRKEEHNSTSPAAKASGKSGKNSVDAPKEDYVHVRARRGQATNSHSLAERVRREKISERMKFLQDLVPGCSKVTGKAVMLDEIINYVQSLQCQVEFLSMKLAAVNPRLDTNIEQLLSKEISNAWDNELHNVVQMDFSGNAALNVQELHGLPPPGHMKDEP